MGIVNVDDISGELYIIDDIDTTLKVMRTIRHVSDKCFVEKLSRLKVFKYFFCIFLPRLLLTAKKWTILLAPGEEPSRKYNAN